MSGFLSAKRLLISVRAVALLAAGLFAAAELGEAAAIASNASSVHRDVSPALVPNAIAFRDPDNGILGTGSESCGPGPSGVGCRESGGTISATTDGGRTWRVVVRTSRPVVSVSYARVHTGIEHAVLDDGENLGSSNGRTWTPVVASPPEGTPCGAGGETAPMVSATPYGRAWVLCELGVPGAGNEAKAVYRQTLNGWKRVAWTPFGRPPAYGGISSYGYPQGIAIANNGFGLIWESRGTLYVTRDGGSDWTPLPNVARPEVDFGVSGAALPHGVGFVLLERVGVWRLLETRDAGRAWRPVHRWPS